MFYISCFMYILLHLSPGTTHVWLSLSFQLRLDMNEHADAWKDVTSVIAHLASVVESVKKDIAELKEEFNTTQSSHNKLVESLQFQRKHIQDFEGSMERKIEHPRYKVYNKKQHKMEDRTKQFSTHLYMWLVEEYKRGEKLPKLLSSEVRSRVRHGTVLHVSIIARFKQKKKINDNVKWGDATLKPYRRLLYEKLENEANPYIPLGACVRFWGARVIIAKHWSNMQRSMTDKELKKIQGTCTIIPHFYMASYR